VGTTDEIAPGQRKVVEIDGRSIGVFNVDGRYYALRNTCPHAGAPLCEGTLSAEARGRGGFGYDPAFLPADVADGRTMAELSAAEKDAISHRGRAARALEEWLAR